MKMSDLTLTSQLQLQEAVQSAQLLQSQLQGATLVPVKNWMLSGVEVDLEMSWIFQEDPVEVGQDPMDQQIV